MNPLILKLKNDHAALSDILIKVKAIGVNSEESKTLLLQAKNALLLHLKKEDAELYPVLRKAGLTNEDVSRKLSLFGKDMEEITKFVLEFFDHVEHNKYNPMDYAINFGKLVSVLSNRINREETILYPLFENCAG